MGFDGKIEQKPRKRVRPSSRQGLVFDKFFHDVIQTRLRRGIAISDDQPNAQALRSAESFA